MKYLILLTFLFASCSSEPAVEYRKVGPKPSPTTTPSDWALIAPLVDEHCQGCHSIPPRVDIGSDAAFRASGSAQRVKSGSMPPGGGLDPLVKTQLSEYN